MEKKIHEIVKDHPSDPIMLDLDSREYPTSAGLRVI